MRPVNLLLAVALLAIPAEGRTQTPDAEVRIALAWHKLTGEPLDVQRLAQQSDAVRRATNFDRPDALAAEVARLEALVAAADPGEEFTMTINDNISEYDHAAGEFSVTLFQPGYYIPVDAWGQQYQVVFANAESARPIAMPRDQARDFDTRLNAMYRRVLNEVRFRVIGKGDPAGGVTGQRVVRAELLGARLLDAEGRVVHTPTVAPLSTALAASPEATPFDASAVDIAGLRVGVSADDLEATLTRLYGTVERGGPPSNGFPGVAGMMEVNSLGCMSIPGRPEARPGSVCVTAWLDGSETVRAIRIERLFPPANGEALRKALVSKYGPVSDAQGGRGFTLSWGPEVDRRLGSTRALQAIFAAHESMMGMMGNRIPDISVVLHLVDAEWASRQSK